MGFYIYRPVPKWMAPPDWRPFHRGEPFPKLLSNPPPGWRPVVGGVNPFTLEPMTNQIVAVFSPEDLPKDISGQYGPGAYASWLLVMLSSMIATIVTRPHTPDQHRARVDADILTTNIYAIVAAADLFSRAYRYPSNSWGASYQCAGQVVWSAWIFSIATIGPSRGEASNPRLGVQYIMLWIFTVLQALTTQYVFADIYLWRPGLKPVILTMLRNTATVTIPLAIYYRWSAAIPYRFSRLLAGIVFVLWYTHGTIFIRHRWIFRPLPVYNIAVWRFRVLFPQARAELRELDQAVSLATPVLILLWQWKVWKLGLIAIQYANNSMLRTQSIGGDTPVELEDISAMA